MEPADLKRRTSNCGSGMQQVLEVAGDPGRRWALVTASRPGMSINDDRRANAALRQELRAAGLDYWLIFAEWREDLDSPTGEWRRFAFVEGAGHRGFRGFVSSLLGRHRQPAGLVGVDGRASIIRSTGEAIQLGQFDLRSAVAAYGRSFGGTGDLTLVRAFVPVGAFVATVKHAAENRTSPAAAR